ncbi:hypothetical protein Hanom_Chr01g00052171 [Helianthus anomalus]
METCNACIAKDKSLRSDNVEFTKIEKVFKEKCNEMLQNENILKQKEEELTQKCSANNNECLQKKMLFKK